ncbi:MAG: tetratricopeptide repeat protein [Gammaproteobacteria bacterium]|nr:tetratricopeptide repeat protein [Gammaproteobacteria bacterium]
MFRVFNNPVIALLGVCLIAGCASLSTDDDKTDVVAGADVDVTGAPSWAQSAYKRALNAIEKEKYDQAEANLIEIVAKLPELAGPHANLGIVYARTERPDLAEQAFVEALALNPKSKQTHNEMGVLLRQTGHFAEAEQAYKNAIKLDADYAIAHHNLGVLYDLYLSRPQQALKHYRRYVQLEPKSEEMVGKWIKDLDRRFPSSGQTDES